MQVRLPGRDAFIATLRPARGSHSPGGRFAGPALRTGLHHAAARQRRSQLRVDLVPERLAALEHDRLVGVEERTIRLAGPAHGLEVKCTMHCPRLGFPVIELLETGKLKTEEAADWISAVRQGKVTIDDVWQRCLKLDGQLEEMQADSLKPGPDRRRIDRYLIDVHQRVWDRWCP